MKKIPLFVILMISSLIASAQLIINPAIIPTDGVQNIFAGSGLSISNIQYTGSINALGSFTTDSISTGLGFSSGLVLSTGYVSQIADSSSHYASAMYTVAGSDPQLAGLVTEIIEDAAVLEFDFIPSSDSVEFRYVFASEEYPEYVGDIFNDVFGFFLSGPNPAGVAYNNLNIARIPGTNLPITINNVNENSNSQLYVNNSTNQSIVYDGMTVVLTAKALVSPCEIYHIKIAIGDVADEVYDSGVFLEANSFSSIGGCLNSGVVTGDTGICIGSIAPSLTIVNNAWPFVRWESSVFPFTTWTPIVDTATTYFPGILTQTTLFHAVVQSPCSEVNSMFATVLVDSMPIPQFSYTASGLSAEFINESTNATSYLWNFGYEGMTSSETNPLFDYTEVGQYPVLLTAINGSCSATTSQIVTVTNIGVAENINQILSVYPIPSSGILTVQFDKQMEKNTKLNVFDIAGKLVYSKEFLIQKADFTSDVVLPNLNDGVYFVQIMSNQMNKNIKITIKR